MSNISIVFTVDEAAAMRAWQRQQLAAAKMRSELDRLKGSANSFGNQIRKALDGAAASAAKATANTSGMVLGWLAVGRAVAQISQALDEIETKSREVGLSFDEAFRKFNIQAGLKGLQAKEAQRQIQQTAVDLAMNPVEAAGMAEQLVSSGFTEQEAKGGSLREMMKLMAGTNQAMSARGEGAVPIKDLVQAASSYLNNQGMDKTAASINRFATVMQSAFKQSNLQLEDAKELAGESSNFRGILSMEEQIAMLAEIRDTNPSAPESVTGMRNIVLRTSAITEPAKQEALKQAGLTREQINGIGENYIDGLKVLRDNLQTKPQQVQNDVGKILFEERGVSFFKTLMQPGRLEHIQKNAATGFTDKAGYEADVVAATSGKSAQARRLQGEEDIRLGNKAQDTVSFQEASRAARTVAVEKYGMSETEAALRQNLAWAASKVGLFTPNFGQTDEEKQQRITAQSFSLFSPHIGSMSKADEFGNEMRRKLKASEGPGGEAITRIGDQLLDLAMLRDELQDDDQIDHHERSAAKRRMDAAHDAVVKDLPAIPKKDNEALLKRMFDLIQAIEGLTKVEQARQKQPAASSAQTPMQETTGIIRGVPRSQGFSRTGRPS